MKQKKKKKRINLYLTDAFIKLGNLFTKLGFPPPPTNKRKQN